MNIKDIKNKFEKLLKIENKDVNDLKKDDKPYAFIHGLKLVGNDGKTLTMVQKFALLGYERKPKVENPILKGARLLKEYLNSGRTIEQLSKKDFVFRYINDSKILGEDGHLLTLEEKFKAMGYERPSKRTTDVVGKIRQKIEEYIARTGSSIDLMTKKDPEYKYIWGVDLKGEDGHPLTIEEKFAIAGFDRKRKYSVNVKQDLIDAVNEYLANGGSFHVVRKTLPFYSKLYIYCDHLAKKDGFRKSYETIMKDLGYKEYSDLYYRYSFLKNLSLFRDEEGYVDSYKSDKKMKAFVNDSAIALNVPIAVVVELICEEELRDCCLSVDYLTYVKSEIMKYIKQGKTLDGVSRENPELYGKISYLRKYISTNYGENLSSYDVLVVLGLDHIKNNFKTDPAPEKNIECSMSGLFKLARQQNGKIYKKDLTQQEYKDAVIKSIRMGITTKALFKIYDIDYVDGRNYARLSKIITDKYPYIDEMRERKHQLILESGVSVENGACEEEIFEQNIKSSLQAYEEYKEKIYKKETSLIKNSNGNNGKNL